MPRGTLRLHVAGAAESFLSGPLLAGVLGAHPHVQLDLFLSDEPLDIVGEGYARRADLASAGGR